MTCVPDTNDFTLLDVVGVVGGANLAECFANSVDAYFDPLYKGDKTTLLNFRHYCIADPPVAPTVTTTVVTDISDNAAKSGGNVTDDGGAPVTVRGVCWNTTGTPTTANSKTTDGTGIGSFISNLTYLISGTTYYVRAYATNSAGTSYGNEVSFTTTSTVPTVHEWFLPSLQECLYLGYHMYGYLPVGLDPPLSVWNFWTSSEQNATNAWYVNAKALYYNYMPKTNTANMRVYAVRSFNSSTLYNIKDVGPKGGRIFWMNYTPATRVSVGGGLYEYYECHPLPAESMGVAWSSPTNIATGAIAQGANTGKANTLTIVNATTASAAKLCYDLTD
jgi:hypothetical protein